MKTFEAIEVTETTETTERISPLPRRIAAGYSLFFDLFVVCAAFGSFATPHFDEKLVLGFLAVFCSVFFTIFLVVFNKWQEEDLEASQ